MRQRTAQHECCQDEFLPCIHPLPACLLVQEYNREASLPAASPRMTRAQRRKSMAAPVGRSRQPEAALEEEEQEEQQAQPQLQQKKAAANRRKSMAVTEQVGGQASAGSSSEWCSNNSSSKHACLLACSTQYQSSLLAALGCSWLIVLLLNLPCPVLPVPRPAPCLQERRESVAAEVAALNAEMCAQLDGMIAEDSPEKGPRCLCGVTPGAAAAKACATGCCTSMCG